MRVRRKYRIGDHVAASMTHWCKSSSPRSFFLLRGTFGTMTTAYPVPLRPNTTRMLTTSDAMFLADNPLGLFPQVRQRGWEAMYASPIWPGMISIDDSIAAGYPFCHSWPIGQWPEGQQPMAVEHPVSRVKYGCTPRSVLDFPMMEAHIAGYAQATRKRTDRLWLMDKKAMIHVGLPPLKAFAGMTVAQRNVALDAMTRFVTDCGYRIVSLDLGALASQQWGKTPAMYWAEHLLARGIDVCIEAQPFLHPGIFPWLDGRFGVVAGVSQWSVKKPENEQYLRPETARYAVKTWHLYVQGTEPTVSTVKVAEEFSARTDIGGGHAIVNFDSPSVPTDWWYRPATIPPAPA